MKLRVIGNHIKTFGTVRSNIARRCSSVWPPNFNVISTLRMLGGVLRKLRRYFHIFLLIALFLHFIQEHFVDFFNKNCAVSSNSNELVLSNYFIFYFAKANFFIVHYCDLGKVTLHNSRLINGYN